MELLLLGRGLATAGENGRAGTPTDALVLFGLTGGVQVPESLVVVLVLRILWTNSGFRCRWGVVYICMNGPLCCVMSSLLCHCCLCGLRPLRWVALSAVGVACFWLSVVVVCAFGPCPGPGLGNSFHA